jgi:hypothetical protein
LDERGALRVSLREGLSGKVRIRNGFVQKARFMIVFEQIKSFLCVWGQFDGAQFNSGAQFLCALNVRFYASAPKNNHFYAAGSDFDRYSPFVVV